MADEKKEFPPIEIRPGVTVLSIFRYLNYKAWFALAEFIDNAIQSSLNNQSALQALHGDEFKLKIKVTIDTTVLGSITIEDNAAGISGVDFPRAFRAAELPINRDGLSEFGMGMKSAACWFAKNWSVRTKSIGETVERTINFDIKNIVDNNLNSLVPDMNYCDKNAHYTVVTLRNLHHIPHGRTINKIKEHLASIYRMYINSKQVEIKIGDDILQYDTPPILKAPKYSEPGIIDDATKEQVLVWRKEINLALGNGQSITGFVALRETGSTRLAGFSLFRRNRLIVGSVDEKYRPDLIFKNTNSYAYQRIFGELHVEGFEVSHTKDGFRWEQHEESILEKLKALLEQEPLDLISQAENYRALPTKKHIQQQAILATELVAQYIEEQVAPLLVDSRANPADPPELLPEIMPSPLQASERKLCIDDSFYVWNITLRTSVEPARNEWFLMSKLDQNEGSNARTRSLIIDVSLAHPFSSRFIGTSHENIELFLRIASAIGVSLMLSEDITGEPPQSVLHHFNYLMRGKLMKMEFTE